MIEIAPEVRTAGHANEPAGTVLRFGVFEADVRACELKKAGRRIELQEQPFRLLVLLLETPGQVVTREELHSKLWPQTTVDFDHGLNKAISKIREALGDSSDHPRFVETVARRGYRFLADVAIIRDKHLETDTDDPASQEQPVSSSPPVKPQKGQASNPAWKLRWVGLIL